MVSKSPLTSLAELVKRTREAAGISLIEVERRTGKAITEGHLSRIENGFVTNVKPDKLRAIARGLKIPLPVIAAAALGFHISAREERHEQLIRAFDALPQTYQDDLLRFAELLEQTRGVKDAQETRNPGRSRDRRAA